MGADVVLNYKEQDVVAEIKRLTGGGADVAIEALGQQTTFENCLRVRASRRHGFEPRRLLGPSHGAARRRSRPASATTRSSRRCARAARSACGG